MSDSPGVSTIILSTHQHIQLQIEVRTVNKGDMGINEGGPRLLESLERPTLIDVQCVESANPVQARPVWGGITAVVWPDAVNGIRCGWFGG